MSVMRESDLIFVSFANRVLGLTVAEFLLAAERGAHLLPAKPTEAIGRPPEEEQLLTAEQISERTGVQAAWYLEAARKGEVPHYRLGRYVRFALSEVKDKGRRKPKQPLALVR